MCENNILCSKSFFFKCQFSSLTFLLTILCWFSFFSFPSFRQFLSVGNQGPECQKPLFQVLVVSSFFVCVRRCSFSFFFFCVFFYSCILKLFLTLISPFHLKIALTKLIKIYRRMNFHWRYLIFIITISLFYLYPFHHHHVSCTVCSRSLGPFYTV